MRGRAQRGPRRVARGAGVPDSSLTLVWSFQKVAEAMTAWRSPQAESLVWAMPPFRTLLGYKRREHPVGRVLGAAHRPQGR